MGLTQHRYGVQTIQMLVNLLLLRGNIGKEGAGILPVRGHSNVQGQRTVGITEKAAKVPADHLRRQFGFEPPGDDGVNTVEACEGILDGSICGFIGLGGNFVRAIPDTLQMEPAWRRLRLSVQVSTKLNRNHLITGAVSYILPCLGVPRSTVRPPANNATPPRTAPAAFAPGAAPPSRPANCCYRNRQSSRDWPRRRWRPTRCSTGTPGSRTTA